jgi:hypothetical protein
MNIENEIMGSFILNDLLQSLKDARGGSIFLDSSIRIFSDVSYAVDIQVRTAIKIQARRYEYSK